MSKTISRLGELNLHPYMSHGSDGDFIVDFVKTLDPPVDTAIEIDTMNGLGTVALAQVARKVYTFDINLRNAEYVWELFNVRHKICLFVGKDSVAINEEINNRVALARNAKMSKVNFNLSFIDGDHSIEAVKYDFEMVKFTKRVLFHDVQVKAIGEFVKSIGGKLLGNEFGYWEDK